MKKNELRNFPSPTQYSSDDAEYSNTKTGVSIAKISVIIG